jgi:hypothetical protein
MEGYCEGEMKTMNIESRSHASTAGYTAKGPPKTDGRREQGANHAERMFYLSIAFCWLGK